MAGTGAVVAKNYNTYYIFPSSLLVTPVFNSRYDSVPDGYRLSLLDDGLYIGVKNS